MGDSCCGGDKSKPASNKPATQQAAKPAKPVQSQATGAQKPNQ